MRAIANSDAYQLSSRYNGTYNSAWDALYARKFVRRLWSEEVHDAIVQGCGNDTMVLVVGALERIWAGHASEVYESDTYEPPALDVWRASLRDHQRIATMIDRGDAKVSAFALKHLEATHTYMSTVDGRRRVTGAATAALS